MAYSNTVGATTFNTSKVITASIRRCKLPAQQITSEYLEIAKDQLFLFLGDLANQGAPLWCVEKQLYPLYVGQNALTLDVGTVDVLNSFFRTTAEVTGTDTDTATSHKVQFSSATAVTTVGLFWTAASAPLIFERSDDNVTWETVQTESPSATADEVTWYDLDSSVASTYFRVRATSGVLSATVYLGNNPYQVTLSRLSRDDYTNLPNLSFQSDRVLQFWFDRQVPQPIMRLWPTPSDGALTSQILVWRHRQIMDVGTLTQELEIPQRWYEAVVAGLARKMAREIVEVDAKIIPQLDADAAQAMSVAQAEERDNSPIRWAPNLSPYTA